MWRAMFLAIGIFVCTIGAECLLIDKAMVITNAEAAGPLGPGTGPRLQEVSPPEWAPWTLLGAGAVVMIYSFTIPQRVKG